MQKLFFGFAVALILLLFTHCSKDNSSGAGKDPKAQQKPIKISAPVANNITDFSFSFFRQLQKDPKVSGNVFASPLSLHIALGMLVNGATDETKAEIMDVLKAGNLTQDELNEAYKTLLAELPKADKKVNLGLANSVWYKNNFPVEKSYLTTMKDVFEAQITGLPFAPGDEKIINQWASDKTNGKIKEVLKEISPDAIMFLLNALYFKGDWAMQFDKKYTVAKPFNLQDGTTKNVQMMNQTAHLNYTGNSDFRLLELPYGNQQFVATLILPQEGKTIESVMDDLTGEKWQAAQKSLGDREVEVGLPKFSLEQKFELNDMLQALGMKRAFSPSDVELYGLYNPLGKGNKVFVSFVKQNTFLQVDEEGSEAAAVTTIGMELTSAGPGVDTKVRFICDRPFGLVIGEKTSNTILFMGKIVNP
ncbi:MAG: serpin family protein [Niabella sp.]